MYSTITILFGLMGFTMWGILEVAERLFLTEEQRKNL